MAGRSDTQAFSGRIFGVKLEGAWIRARILWGLLSSHCIMLNRKISICCFLLFPWQSFRGFPFSCLASRWQGQNRDTLVALLFWLAHWPGLSRQTLCNGRPTPVHMVRLKAVPRCGTETMIWAHWCHFPISSCGYAGNITLCGWI